MLRTSHGIDSGFGEKVGKVLFGNNRLEAVWKRFTFLREGTVNEFEIGSEELLGEEGSRARSDFENGGGDFWGRVKRAGGYITDNF